MANIFVVRPVAVFCALVLTLSACGGPEVASGIYDPYEIRNREIHEGNKILDQTFVRPLANSYGESLPEPVRAGVSNFAGNLSIPGTVVNDLLQFNIKDAFHNTARFLINTTLGLGGVLDPATKAGIETRSADFGETLHVWGVKEGPYLELLVIGPTTTRDAFGKVVDVFLDPLGQVVPKPQRYALPATYALSRIGDRYRFRGSFDSIYYESADSYAQSRLLYLENRRFNLGEVVSGDDDLYEGLYDELIPE